MDLTSLSYHGIRKLAAIPSVDTRCIPLETGSGSSGSSSPRMPHQKLTPNLEENVCGYSPLLKRSAAAAYIPTIRDFGGGLGSMGSPFKRKRGKNKPENSIIGVLAAQTLKIASINGLGELDKLENELEEEINFENRSNANTCIGRLRREGHHHLHSKVVLFLVVILNIIDCLLVMGELTLDFHHVSHLLTTKKAMVDSFANELGDKYSPYLDDLVDEERHVLLQAVLDSSIIWPQNIIGSVAENVTLAASQCHSFITSAANFHNESYDSFVQSFSSSSSSSSSSSNNNNSSNSSSSSISDWRREQPMSMCFQAMVDVVEDIPHHTGYQQTGAGQHYTLSSVDKPNEKLIVVAHKLHYISVAILSVLVLVLILKIICAGKRFLRSKMAVFDGIVVVISFILDIVFIKGIHIFTTDDFVIILTFLLPWRIIRVLNSLIAAVLDKQRLNLKIIYTQKKKISRNLTEVNNKVEVMQRQIQILQGLCSSRGITDGDVRKILGTDPKHEKHEKSESKKHHHSSGHGLASMMALGKLAFQAADALAPMPDINGRSTPTSPVATPMFSNNSNSSINKQPPPLLQTANSTNSVSTTDPHPPPPSSSSSNSTTTTTTTTQDNNNKLPAGITGNAHTHHTPMGNGSVPAVITTSSSSSDNLSGMPRIDGQGGGGTTNTATTNTTTTNSTNNPVDSAAPTNTNNTRIQQNHHQQQQQSVPNRSNLSNSSQGGRIKSEFVENNYNNSNMDVPDISESASLDIESAATMSMDLRDDDDDDDTYDLSASTDDVNVHFEMDYDTPELSVPSVNDVDATSRL